MNEPIFPNDNAILKFNVDKNGLYMNNAFGENDYTSPYYGVSDIGSSYVPTFHIPKEVRDKIVNHNDMQEAIHKGCQWLEEGGFPIKLKAVDSPLKAAYISQFFVFSDNCSDKIESLIIHTFLRPDTEVESWLNTFPDFIYKPFTLKDYKDNIDDYKINQKLIDEVQLRKIKAKESVAKKKRMEKNKVEFLKRMEVYAKKIHYKYDVMTEELAIKLMKKKFK